VAISPQSAAFLSHQSLVCTSSGTTIVPLVTQFTTSLLATTPLRSLVWQFSNTLFHCIPFLSCETVFENSSTPYLSCIPFSWCQTVPMTSWAAQRYQDLILPVTTLSFLFLKVDYILPVAILSVLESWLYSPCYYLFCSWKLIIFSQLQSSLLCSWKLIIFSRNSHFCSWKLIIISFCYYHTNLNSRFSFQFLTNAATSLSLWYFVELSHSSLKFSSEHVLPAVTFCLLWDI
jgi:hypothetical protein